MGHPIRQVLTFRASPERVYQVLTDSVVFSQMTGAPARIDPQAGGAFTCFGGKIIGRTIECHPGELLVQAWRSETWEPGFYSVVRFAIAPEGDDTKLALHHTGFPKGQSESLAKDWYDNYWDPMARFLSQ